ncbi:MAG: phospholipase D-like domain-containing protein [Chryseolinea sp.]
MNPLLRKQITKTLTRWDDRTSSRNRNVRLIKEHRYFDADTPTRVKKFLVRRGISPLDTNEILKNPVGIPPLIESVQANDELLRLERVMGTNDLLNICYLQAGLQAGKTIGRVWINNSAGSLVGYGTGFMVSPRLMLTNHHVLPDAGTARTARIEFGYELDLKNNLVPSQIFQLDPSTFFVANEALDFALVAVSPDSQGKGLLSDFGWNKLSIEEGKTIISQWLTIIQHPNGMPKQIGLRENQVIDVLDNFLHYNTDTAPGSSGSAVFNERWEVVALHHSGVWEKDKAGNIMSIGGRPWDPSMGDDQIKWKANEGVRVSSILKFLDNAGLSSEQAKLYEELRNTPAPDDVAARNDESNIHTPASGCKPMTQCTNPDGSFTWTVPVSITVNVGQTATQPTACISATKPKVDVIRKPIIDAYAAAKPETKTTLEKAKAEFLRLDGVIGVRMGYVFENEWITDERAVVVTLRPPKPGQKLSRENVPALPPTFDGYKVQVTGPTFLDLIGDQHGVDQMENLLFSVGVTADEITYTRPTNVVLEKIESTRMRVIAHVSPEEGWVKLQDFLERIEKKLTVGMFDFGAVHILNAIENGAQQGFNMMTLTLQPGESVGEGTKANDIEDAEAVRRLKQHFGSKFQNAWIKIGRVNGWVSSSYHIKVAVKDSKSVWLSSGNWQSSNQPDIPNLENQTLPFLLRTYNREWHAIVHHPALADTFEKFILHDFKNNRNNAPERTEALLEGLNFLVPADPLFSAMEAASDFEPFQAFDEDREFTVTPLLTPDNYYDTVLNLVRGARRELLIQNQTFNAPKDGQDKLNELIEAVLERQRNGVDVFIIFRIVISSVARENVEKLVEMGLDEKSIKVQKNCHTKGIIVDGTTVMLGSQNISNDGISVNRDASLLFEDQPLAQYFRKIFFHDWNKLAKSKIGRESLSLQPTTDTENIPAGMELVTWSDIRETL